MTGLSVGQLHDRKVNAFTAPSEPLQAIALEEHQISREMATERGLTPLLIGSGDALDDLGEGRLAAMDEAEVDVLVLSALSPHLQQVDPEVSVVDARAFNQRMADAIAAYPDRYRAFAALPMTDPRAAVEELSRAVEELGFLGAMIYGHTRGAWLDHEDFRPVLANAERLGVPIYLHPAFPPGPVFQSYFADLEPELAGTLATSAWGWHAECGLHVLRLAVSGTLDRFPDLQFIIGHMGENLPFSLARADEWLTPTVPHLSASVAEIIQRQVHVTISGYLSDAPLLCALMVFGADRLLYAADSPFSGLGETSEFLRRAPLSPIDRRKIAHLNAERLLRIS